MAKPIAPDYGQQFLLPPALEDWIGADHPARFIREFVDQLDLKGMKFVIPAASEGRPPYAPSLLLKIWLYGYFHRIRSTRKLEVACREQLGLLWLSGMIQPDHNSLWRFWRENKKALRGVFKQTVQLATRSGCVGLALQAVDGTKIEACSSGYSGMNKEQMERLLSQLDEVLDQTEAALMEEPASVESQGYRLPKGLSQCQALREQIQKGLAQMAEENRKHYHPQEPEARRMPVEGRNRFAYNNQAIADGKQGVIVACETTQQENDQGQLGPMSEQARENLGVGAQATVTLADSGYGSGADIQAAQAQGHKVLVKPLEGKPGEDHPYAAQHFNYDPSTGKVHCPQGIELHREGQTTKRGMKVVRYRCRCRDCPVQAQCTRDPKGRQVEIWPHTPAVQKMRQKLLDPVQQQLLQRRGAIIEPKFGQIKEQEGFRRFSVRGLEGARAQWTFICTTLNLRILYRQWQENQAPKGPGAAAAAVRAVLGGKILQYWICHLGKRLGRLQSELRAAKRITSQWSALLRLVAFPMVG